MKVFGLSFCFLVLLMVTRFACAQPFDERKLEDLRGRYQQGMYITDQALNNLNVHLRGDKTVATLVKLGFSEDALNVFRKFLTDISYDRAFLQLELQHLRALFKRNNDTTAGIQSLAWTETEVYNIAVLCDQYLQGQVKLGLLTENLNSGKSSIADSWMMLEKLRHDPYVPAVTMAAPLNNMVAYAVKNQSQLDSLAGTNPNLFGEINRFKRYATDGEAPTRFDYEVDWPIVVKADWNQRSKLLESYGKSTDPKFVSPWQEQLGDLQNIEFSKFIRSNKALAPK